MKKLGTRNHEKVVYLDTMAHSFCLDTKKLNNFEIEGDIYSRDAYKAVVISLEMCTEAPNCHTMDKI